MFEKEFVDWIAGRLATPLNHSTQLGVGDDAAVLGIGDLATVVTTDTLCDQVHFDTKVHSLKRIGRKSVAVSISDVHAMGGRATQAVLTFFLPVGLSLSHAKEIFLGAVEMATSQGVDIVGGDTNRYDGPLIVGSTVIGQVDPQRVWKIDGAKIDDWILVTGTLGGSILGRHMDFEPRSKWVKSVASQFNVNAATDISDSLSLDLSYLVSKSDVGAEIWSESIPVSAAAMELANQTGQTRLHHALTDGEDFELILCVEPAVGDGLLAKWPKVLTRIGTVVAEAGIGLVDQDGNKSEYQPAGYVH